MVSVLSGLEPKLLWKYFDEIRKIPRESKNETAIGEYIVSVAKAHGLTYDVDAVGNVVVRKPATPGHEKADVIILQSHLDMVCEKNNDTVFDFKKDAIQLEMDGEWLTAKGTTLGADDGIGVAAELAILEDSTMVHGPLELLFTIDEETGLTGAMGIQPGFLKGHKFLNLDSEEEGVFTIGCSGGADTGYVLPITREKVSKGKLFTVNVSGLKGGHSGLDINTGRGNAIKMLNRILWWADREFDIKLVNFKGGNKRNAIAREAEAEVIFVSDSAAVKTKLESLFADIQFEFKTIEPGAKLTVTAGGADLPDALTAESQKVLQNFLYALPHGVMRMSRDIEGLVESSTNLATISTEADKVVAGQSTRSSIGSALAATRAKLKAIAEFAGAEVNQPDGYPGWAPNLDSEMLEISKKAYKACFNTEPKVAAIHAGLECGLIGEKFPGMDMVSFGPDLQHPHSPDEKVHVGSVEKFWKHIVKILEMTA